MEDKLLPLLREKNLMDFNIETLYTIDSNGFYTIDDYMMNIELHEHLEKVMELAEKLNEEKLRERKNNGMV